MQVKTLSGRIGGRDLEFDCFENGEMFPSLARAGVWERHITHFFVQNAFPHCARFFDIGANCGYYSTLARTVNPAMDIVSVEPIPAAARLVQLNVERAAARHGEEVGDHFIVNQAVGSGLGYVRFHVREDEVAASHVDPDGGFEVPQTTIDKLTATFGAPTLIKMDIEGLEWDALSGGMRTLEKCKPVLVMEFAPMSAHRSKADYGRVLRDVEALGYDLRFFRGHSFSAAELIDAAGLKHLGELWNRRTNKAHMDIVAMPLRAA